MKHNYTYLLFAILLAFVFNGCRNDDDSFTNRVFTSSDRTQTVLIKQNVTDGEGLIEATMAQLESFDVVINYKVDPTLVEIYNLAYFQNAIMLPSGHYELEKTSLTIPAGRVRSTKLPVRFMKINELDRDQLYVLPVTISNANIAVLERSRTTYFVFKGAALINVVADMEKNYLHIGDTWSNPGVVNNLTQVTMEALIRVRDYDRLISTVMGIEGQFLIRLGDAGFPPNQIQIASSKGNFPAADSNKGLPTNEWVHIAMTYNAATKDIKIYVNGTVQTTGNQDLGSVINLGVGGSGGFYIGRSWEDSRYLAGEISECRIWNTIRTQEEIATYPYEVDPTSQGLVAYWKCNEGGGNAVYDKTGNGNNLKSKSDIKWNPVALPENKK